MARSFLPSIFSSHEKEPLFQTLQKEVDRVFDDFRKTPFLASESFIGSEIGLNMPRLDVSESEDVIEISAELPGVAIDDIEISAVGGNLVITGEKTQEEKKEEDNYTHLERTYGKFSRTVPLGFDIDASEVEAKLADGVLRVTVNKPAEFKGTKHKIKISKTG